MKSNYKKAHLFWNRKNPLRDSWDFWKNKAIEKEKNIKDAIAEGVADGTHVGVGKGLSFKFEFTKYFKLKGGMELLYDVRKIEGYNITQEDETYIGIEAQLFCLSFEAKNVNDEWHFDISANFEILKTTQSSISIGGTLTNPFTGDALKGEAVFNLDNYLKYYLKPRRREDDEKSE